MCKPREVHTVRYAGREGLKATLYLQNISRLINSGNAFSALDAGEMRGRGRVKKNPHPCSENETGLWDIKFEAMCCEGQCDSMLVAERC